MENFDSPPIKRERGQSPLVKYIKFQMYGIEWKENGKIILNPIQNIIKKAFLAGDAGIYDLHQTSHIF